MHIGIVICSRLKSSRLPNKAHLKLENRTVIGNLVYNLCRGLNLPIVVTVPNSDFNEYLSDDSLPRGPNVLIHNSIHEGDPLARTAQVAKQFSFDAVIRITHDKIFIDIDALKQSIKAFKNEKADYLYSSTLLPGTNFEIISYKCLQEASNKYKNVEHISYAVRDVSKKTVNYNYKQDTNGIEDLSLLIDYENDFKLMQVIYSAVGQNAVLSDVIKYAKKNSEIITINKKPLVSIYTCAYNSAEFIDGAFKSVLEQDVFSKCEYILVDDCSKDNTFEKMAILSSKYSNIKIHRNPINYGLATSSNIALSMAQGKYLLRIDSDDYFASKESVKQMLKYISENSFEIVYPDHYFGSWDKVECGAKNNHVGGAIFNKSALNFIKFTDGLRGYEGYDLFLRAKDRLKIGYFKEPMFFYSQRDGSLSKSDKKNREIIKKQIEVINAKA